jgi:outer membrane protein OmpA-like peptidoglycan-associated protein
VKESATSLLGSIKSLISILSEKIVKRHEIMSYINGVFIIVLLVSFFILIFPDEPKQYSEKQVKSGAVRDDISLQHAKLNQQKSSQQNNTASPRKAKVILVSQPVNNNPLPVTANKVVEKTPTPNSQIHNKNKEMLPKLSSEAGNVENHNLVIAKAKPENPETTPEIVREKQENTKTPFLPQYTTREMAKRDFHRLTINVDTQFARGSAELSPALQNRLTKLAKLLKNKNASVIHIIGYCDRTGSQERNIYLSVRRADAAANFLVNQGVSRNHIFTEGHGFSEPVSLTDAALNRRVEIFSKGVRPELASNVHSND